MEGIENMVESVFPERAGVRRQPVLAHAGPGDAGRVVGETGSVPEATAAAEAVAPARPGTYARGAESVDAILKAALNVLIDEGAGAFTIRRIAAACGMKVGNVSYHFARKEMLVQVLLEELLETYEAALQTRVHQPGTDARERLRRMIVLCLDDIAGKRTTRLFTELWALANQDTFIAERVRLFYSRVHDNIANCVRELNPALSPEQTQAVALYISSALEGATPFCGFEKPWAAQMPAYTALACRSLIELAVTIRPDEIPGLSQGSLAG